MRTFKILTFKTANRKTKTLWRDSSGQIIWSISNFLLNRCNFVHLYTDLWRAQAELLCCQKSLLGGQVLDHCCHVDNVFACQEGLVNRGRDLVVEFQNWGERAKADGIGMEMIKVFSWDANGIPPPHFFFKVTDPHLRRPRYAHSAESSRSSPARHRCTSSAGRWGVPPETEGSSSRF